MSIPNTSIGQGARRKCTIHLRTRTDVDLRHDHETMNGIHNMSNSGEYFLIDSDNTIYVNLMSWDIFLDDDDHHSNNNNNNNNNHIERTGGGGGSGGSMVCCC